MKALIPAAGKGTRMRPFTYAYPKEVMPIGDKAVIEHAIETAKEAGIDDIVVVIGWKQNAVLDYLGSGERLGVDITYVIQEDKNGLAGAVKAGEHVIGDEDFAVVLGDNYLTDKSALRKLKDKHEENGFEATIGAVEVEDVTVHGIIDGEDGRVKGLLEKPSEDEAPSRKGVAGIYILGSSIFDAIDQIDKGTGGEYQLTDALEHVRRKEGEVGYMEIPGEHIDVGTPERLKKANHHMKG